MVALRKSDEHTSVWGYAVENLPTVCTLTAVEPAYNQHVLSKEDYDWFSECRMTGPKLSEAAEEGNRLLDEYLSRRG